MARVDLVQHLAQPAADHAALGDAAMAASADRFVAALEQLG
jgi:hypothetical protein